MKLSSIKIIVQISVLILMYALLSNFMKTPLADRINLNQRPFKQLNLRKFIRSKNKSLNRVKNKDRNPNSLNRTLSLALELLHFNFFQLSVKTINILSLLIVSSRQVQRSAALHILFIDRGAKAGQCIEARVMTLSSSYMQWCSLEVIHQLEVGSFADQQIQALNTPTYNKQF